MNIMNQLKSMKPPSIFLKLFLTFFLVITPLYLITLRINLQGSEGIRYEMSESIQARTDYFMNMLESEIGRITDSLPEYVIDQDLRNLSSIGDQISQYERIALVNALQRRLYLMKYSSLFIADAKAYVPLIKRTVTSANYEEGINEPEFDALQHQNSGGPMIYWNDRLFLSLAYPANAKRKPIFVLGIELSIKQMQEMLNSVARPGQGNAMLINLKQNWSIGAQVNKTEAQGLQSFLQSQQEKGIQSGLSTITLNKKQTIVSYKFSPAINTYLVTFTPEAYLLGPLTTLKNWFWVMSCVSVLIIIFFSYSINKVILRPMRKLIQAFNRMRDIHTYPTLPTNRKDEFGYLYKGFNKMVERLKCLIQEVYEQKIRSQRSELKWLQSQINPHFLYNCFFVLSRLIKKVDTEQAYQFCVYMGNYFQFVTRDKPDEIPLELEIKHARTYVDIQTVCLGNRIKVEFQVPEWIVSGGTVIRIVLQPIIENVYKHVFDHQEGEGFLWIHFEKSGDDLYIHVEDNGSGLDDQAIALLNGKLSNQADEDESSIGIVNVHRRIQMRYGEDCGLMFERSTLGGLHVQMKIKPWQGGGFDVSTARR
ncbi:sensor histidine kinase [Paenibacillus aceris]|uniref:Two-component system sensor histidine kinase YesM n=1 Tax=Paenibacillus aceris TaxID=869555 RepID=A0ABS4HV96_9BACL|nr:histidine kinase [Paenibacillus aceris]MBP1962291.1 two-component system sensor histidine kinase YesM [Paenibacillus aceris]NHW37117.1 histidine kinase [Paenibacillus aceris]